MAEIRILPPSLQIDAANPFQPDLFDLEPLAMGLTNLVGHLSQPLVIALDGGWGSGKTTFLKQWKAQLENSDTPYPVIYFDAFENDYVDDAFAVLVREVVLLLEENSLGDEIRSFKEKAVACGTVLLKAGAKLATKVAVRAASAGLASQADLVAFKDDLEGEAVDLAENFMTSLLDGPKKQKAVIESFREALSHLPKTLSSYSNKEDNRPLIFIIDELDRCRPAFALSLLERIKHFMSVPNIHFVLGVHLQQLCNSVKAQYGGEIDARMYLQKFIALSVAMNLADEENSEKGKQARYINYLIKALSVDGSAAKKIEQCRASLIRIATANSLSLRTIERVYSHLVLATTFSSDSRIEIPHIVSGLCCMKAVRPEMYERAKAKKLAFRDVSAFLGFENQTLNPSKRERDAWAYFLDGEAQENEIYYTRFLFDLNISTPQDLVPEIARGVVDRLIA